MAAIRIARSTGNGSILWPKDVKSATDCPVDLLRSISHADKILDWFENMMPDEVPPEWMWPFDDELNDWFDEIREARKARYSGGGDDADDDTGMMVNDISRE